MKITKPSIRLSEEELSILDQALDICYAIRDKCPDLSAPYDGLPGQAESVSCYLEDFLSSYNCYVNEES